jgi:hypothetical protein
VLAQTEGWTGITRLPRPVPTGVSDRYDLDRPSQETLTIL